MDPASLVPPILASLKYLSYGVLVFYVLRVVIVVFNGKRPEESRRLREAMALGYTAVAAYFIYYSAPAIQIFANNVLDTGSSIDAPSSINTIVVILAALICFAFICNFCRSLWMLKLLDHAIFEPVPGWKALTDTTPKLLAEFAPRAAAAVLFICLEFRLEKIGNWSPDDSVLVLANGGVPPNYLADAGKYGMYLYGCLILWWLLSKLFVKAAMPPLLLIFHAVGLINSAFIWWYAGPLGRDWAWEMILVVGFMAAGALYMILIVAIDIVTAIGSLFSSTKRREGNGTGLARA